MMLSKSYLSDNKPYPKRDAVLKEIRELVYEVGSRYNIQDLCDLKIILSDPFNPLIAKVNENNIMSISPFASNLLRDDVFSKFTFTFQNATVINEYITNEYDLPREDDVNEIIFQTVDFIFTNQELALESIKACIAHELAHLTLGHVSHKKVKEIENLDKRIDTLTKIFCFLIYWYTNIYIAFFMYYFIDFVYTCSYDYIRSSCEKEADKMAAIHYAQGGIHGFFSLQQACLKVRRESWFYWFFILPNGTPISIYLSHGSLDSRMDVFRSKLSSVKRFNPSSIN